MQRAGSRKSGLALCLVYKQITVSAIVRHKLWKINNPAE